MKVTIMQRREVELKMLSVKANVRYWEDAKVNGVKDDAGQLIPCRENDMWCPTIDISTGIITNWKQGVVADINYKVCDMCSWRLFDVKGELIEEEEENYVPNTLSPKENGYGDYIKMHVDEHGKIDKWRFSVEDFLELED